MIKTLICTQCGYVSKGAYYKKGSGLIELVLWLTFLVPGIIYSIWRRRSNLKSCIKCKSQSLIPIDSPRAKKVLEESGQNQSSYQEIINAEIKLEAEKTKKDNRERIILYGGLILLFVVFYIFSLLIQ